MFMNQKMKKKIISNQQVLVVFIALIFIEHESNGDRKKTLSVEKHFNKIRPYLKDITNILKKCDVWKIQLMIATNFTSSKDTDEVHLMHSKSDKIEIMINDKADEVIEKLFELHLKSQ